MKAGDLVELAARNLRESVLRNSLTTLGIGVGVASLVAMLSLGIGLQELANRRLARSGLFDTIVVSSSRGLGRFSRRAFREPSAPRGEPPPRRGRAPGNRAPPRCARGDSGHPIRHRVPLPRQAAVDDGGGPSSFGSGK